ncbi:helix-turn-helix domain-containing protein [Natronomonas salina]|uniref:helix-turn-helix domain-containing protein n=1 Tax=Natronomonas salina TaxID=1710540 RepID=UPI003CCCE3C6
MSSGRSRPPRSSASRSSNRLTEKQQRALEAAFFGDYFQRPRSITGTELADSLDVSSSTFHQHLQTGLRKVLAAVFDSPRQD